MDECAGNVTLGMMVCAPKVYAPVCISDNTLTISASAIASGRKPSKLTINTRWNFGAGVDVAVGRGVAVGWSVGVLIGLGVVVGGGATVGAGVAGDPHEDRKITNRVKSKARRVISG